MLIDIDDEAPIPRPPARGRSGASNLIQAVLIATVFSSLALLAHVAFWAEPRSLSLTAVQVESPAWPRDREPLRAVLLSDIHVDGVHMPPSRVRRLVKAVSSIDPDIVLLAGDYVGGHGALAGPPGAARGKRSQANNALQEEGLRALSSLRARYGVFAAIGNHDCWWDCARVSELLRTGGVTVLQNKAVQARDVWIAGMEDGQTQRPDFAAIRRQVPQGAPVIVLAHNPGLFDWADNGFALMVAGHTHGGQVRLPLIGAPVRASRHTEDAYRTPLVRDGRVLVVSRGLGESGLPVRFMARPEIVLIEFRYGPVARSSRLN